MQSIITKEVTINDIYSEDKKNHSFSAIINPYYSRIYPDRNCVVALRKKSFGHQNQGHVDQYLP